jgi:hypothetical protein
MVHLRDGVFLRESQDQDHLRTLRKVWPRCRGYGKTAANSKTKESQDHMEAIDAIIASIWPAGTERRMQKLQGMTNCMKSPEFHSGRQKAAEGKNVKFKVSDIYCICFNYKLSKLLFKF